MELEMLAVKCLYFLDKVPKIGRVDPKLFEKWLQAMLEGEEGKMQQ